MCIIVAWTLYSKEKLDHVILLSVYPFQPQITSIAMIVIGLSYLALLLGWTCGSPAKIQELETLTFLGLRCKVKYKPGPETITEEKGVSLNQPYDTTTAQGPSVQASTTHIKDDETVISVAANTLMSAYRRLIKHDKPDPSKDLSTFFSKPIRIISGQITIADTTPVTLFSTTCPNDFIFSNPIWDNKLQGLYGARFTMVFTLFINADRFQQGRYLMTWLPYGGGKGNGQVPANWLDIHTRTLEARTALPHVEIDINSQTSVVMRVPFNSAYTAFPISSRTDAANQFGALGELQLWPYEPLVTAAGNNSAGYSVWCHLEDFEVYGAAVPQSAPMDLTQEEQKSSGVGPVSGPLMKVSRASNILAEFPLLSMYAGPVGWAAEIAARAAKVFGWSNPINLAPVTRVVNNVSYPYAGNSDGIDNSMPLTMSSDNKVDVLPGFAGTDEDEMAVLSIASRPAHFSRFTMNEEQLFGTELAVIEVSPFADLNTFVQGGNNIIAMTPLNFASSMFQYWRGSIQYTFEIVKTEFHSGRIMVAFSPENRQTVAVTATYANTDFLYREIIDIRTCNSFTVTVPFVSLSPYKYVDPNLDLNFKTGGIFIYVVDQLIAPSTVSQSITFLVKHSAGPDFELAVPMPIMALTPIGGVTAQSLPFRTSVPDPDTSEVVNIGNSYIPGPTTDYAAAAIGEKVVSFRAYLKRSCRIITTAAGTLPINSVLSFNPFATPCAFIATGTQMAPDYYSILASVFLYARGGVYIKVLTDAPSTVDHLHATVKLEPMSAGSWTTMPRVALSGYSDYTGFPDRGLAPFGGANILFKSKDAKNPDIEFFVPQYLPYINRLNSEALYNSAMGYRTFSSATTSKMGVTIEFEDHNAASIAAPPCYVSRSFADDGNFGCFVTIPVFAYTRIVHTAAV